MKENKKLKINSLRKNVNNKMSDEYTLSVIF